MDMKCWNHSSAVKSRTIERRSHLNVNSGGVDVFRSEGAEDGRVHFCSVRVTGLRRAALQREVTVSRVYERVLAQAVEGVLEPVEGADVRVTVEPTYDGKQFASIKPGIHHQLISPR